MMDEAYAELAQSGKPGETVPLLADEISRFAAICETVISGLEERNPEFLPPSTAGGSGEAGSSA